MTFTRAGIVALMTLFVLGWQSCHIAAAPPMFIGDSTEDEPVYFLRSNAILYNPLIIRIFSISRGVSMATFYLCAENCLVPARGHCIYWILFYLIRFDSNQIFQGFG